MATGGGRQHTADGSHLRNTRPPPQEFVPSFVWSEDSSCHYLLVDLPGFKKEQLKLHVDEHGNVFVSGEKQGRENRITHFEQAYKVPENSELEKITARYEGEVLYVVVPKRVKEQEIDQQTETANHNEELQDLAKEEEVHENKTADLEEPRHGHEKEDGDGKGHLEGENMGTAWREGFWGRTRQTWIQEAGLLGSLVDVLSKNKGIVTAAVLAFSLGVLVSQKFQSSVGNEGSMSCA